MRESFKNLRLALLAVVGIASFHGAPAFSQDAPSQDCVPKHTFTTVTPGKLTVAILSEPPTIDFKDGKLTGLQGEILNAFAKQECLEIETQEIVGAGIIPAVQSGRVDVATGGWYRSSRRMDIIGMSYPIMLSKVAIVGKKEFKTWDELKGLTVGTPQGNLWVEEAKKFFGDNFKLYQSFDQVYADINNGRIDAGLVPYELAKYVTDQKIVQGAVYSVPPATSDLPTTETPPQVGFPYSKDNAEFAAAFDATIKDMHTSGFIKKTMDAVGLPSEVGDVGEPYFID